MVETVLDAGGRLFDSSPMYGRAEELLGELARVMRSGLIEMVWSGRLGSVSDLDGLGVESWAEAVLVWAMSAPGITVAIPATGDVSHARANLRAALHPGFDAAQRSHVEPLWQRR